MSIGLNFSRRIRRTAYTNKVEQAGVSGFSVVNHMLLPKAFKHSVEDDYWHLRKDVQLWDVSTPVSYTHLRAHETKANLVWRLLG